MASLEHTTGVLRGDIRLLRGDSLLLFDPAADAYYKISERAANIISYFSEDLTYQAMLEKLHCNGIDITAEELHDICMFLAGNGLLIPRYGEVAARRERLAQQKKKTWLLRISSSYLFLKFPPWRPERFFAEIAPLVSFLTAPWLLLVWVLPAILGYVLALRDFNRVLEQFANTFSWAGLVKYVLAIVIVKLIHEAAHSLAAIKFNCRVRGIGLGLVFFVPRLYTDTTDSWQLPRKQRLLIDGAGIIAELVIGGIAALLWNFLAPGMLQSTMFYIFAISTLSTLLVNGNIFIRYDGYYIISDLLGIENLMKRSAECVKQSWRWYFLHLGEPSGEKRKFLLICYGISAFVYRIFLYTSICLLIYFSFTRTLAIILLLLEFYALLFYPAAVEIKTLWRLSRKSAGVAAWFIMVLVAAVIGCILFLPLSWGVTLPGETASARKQYVIAEESGYLLNPLPACEKELKQGAVIATLTSPQLDVAIEKIRRTLEYDRELFAQQEVDAEEFSNNEITAQKIKSDRLALEELLRRKDNLTIKAVRSGCFVPLLPDLSAGALLKRNTVIGEIVSDKKAVYAYASDDQVGKISAGQQGSVILADKLSSIPCRVVRIEPVAAKFNSSVLLQPFGGPIAVYKQRENEFIPVQTLYRIELEIPDDAVCGNGRLVKVDLVYSEQLYTYISKTVLSFFRKEF